MERTAVRSLGWILVALPLWAAAEPWETLARRPIHLRARAVEGSAAREVWAEAELNAEAQDLQAAILDSEAYPRFMPYVKESRELERDADGSQLVYTRLEPPVISPRDYVVKVDVLRRVEPDGTGEFANHWSAVPDRVPRRQSVIRLQICEGSWSVVPSGPGRARVVYRTAVDPGGWVPAFLSDMANRSGVADTFKALEREAQRRGLERRGQAANEQRRQARSGEVTHRAKPRAVAPGLDSKAW